MHYAVAHKLTHINREFLNLMTFCSDINNLDMTNISSTLADVARMLDITC